MKLIKRIDFFLSVHKGTQGTFLAWNVLDTKSAEGKLRHPFFKGIREDL
jgi:hypothetical protein